MTNPHAEHELAQLANGFDHWRQGRVTPRGRIPKPLWDHAVSLATVLPISRVAKRLRLSTSELKKRGAAMSDTPSARRLTATLGFVEVTAPSTWLASAVEVELQRADGTRMRIAYHEAQPPLASLVRAFVETP